MYERHFGLRQRPFRATPDSESYYPATSHEAALARLQQAIADDEGLLLLTGEPGTGKTLLAHCLLERLGEETTSAFLTNSHLPTPAALLQAILYDLGQPYEGRGEQELRLTLTDLLLRWFAEGRRTLLIVDEAQHLPLEVLEELRLLGNLEARDGKAVQVLLASQPGLLEKLQHPDLAAFRQRLAVRVHLEPLPVQEAADYLVHQLRAVGGRPERLLTDEALEVLAQGTHGIPRLLNQAGHQALQLAAAAEAAQVDAEAAIEALASLGLEVQETEADAGDSPRESIAPLIRAVPEPEPAPEEDEDPPPERGNGRHRFKGPR